MSPIGGFILLIYPINVPQIQKSFMICLNCKKEFDSKRSTAKFCSDKCRVTISRLSVTESEEVSVTKVSVTEKKPLSVTLRTVKITGKCHGCGIQQESTSICICSTCIAKEVTHKNLVLNMCGV